MKTEEEIKEQVQAYTYKLRTTNNLEEVIKVQGILDGLEWVLSDEEEKKDDGFSEETD